MAKCTPGQGAGWGGIRTGDVRGDLGRNRIRKKYPFHDVAFVFELGDS
jgi:hypothetical protein